jgi:hypothetical protein
MKSRRIHTLIAAVVLLAAGGQASANPTLGLEYTGPANSSAQVSITGLGNNVYSGPYNFSVSSNPSNLNVGSSLSLFCLQYNVNIALNNQMGGSPSNPGPQVIYTVNSLTSSSSPISANNGSSASQVANLLNALWYQYSGNSDQTAFQLAVWELTYDGATDIKNGSANLYSGSFSIPSSNLPSGEAASAANATKWINGLLGSSSTVSTDDQGLANEGTLYALTNGTYQDQLIFVPASAPVVTPAPPGLILAGIGLVAVVGRTRLSRRPLKA